jgi:hypothetical protein
MPIDLAHHARIDATLRWMLERACELEAASVALGAIGKAM